jgi:hypothetical protein
MTQEKATDSATEVSAETEQNMAQEQQEHQNQLRETVQTNQDNK